MGVCLPLSGSCPRVAGQIGHADTARQPQTPKFRERGITVRHEDLRGCVPRQLALHSEVFVGSPSHVGRDVHGQNT